MNIYSSKKHTNPSIMELNWVFANAMEAKDYSLIKDFVECGLIE